ncbi:hypothetical protein KCMC57_up60930 [Kitasatospora sp. CMC57]|uniref:Uncharacterized protein n=1 Tax=Kitasatospora sp. CMC57 TaxID=3231513 RepID=A0AB33KAA2_9ACTN
MSERDWSAELANPESIREVLGTPPRPLTDYHLDSVLIDEREASVTLRFSDFGIPAGATGLWHARGHNAVEFVLVCSGVKNFEVDGWSGWPTTVASFTQRTVVLGGQDKHVSFDTDEICAQSPVGHRRSRAQ